MNGSPYDIPGPPGSFPRPTRELLRELHEGGDAEALIYEAYQRGCWELYQAHARGKLISPENWAKLTAEGGQGERS